MLGGVAATSSTIRLLILASVWVAARTSGGASRTSLALAALICCMTVLRWSAEPSWPSRLGSEVSCSFRSWQKADFPAPEPEPGLGDVGGTGPERGVGVMVMGWDCKAYGRVL